VSDEDKLQNDVRKGLEAQALLDNSLFKETLAYLEQSYIAAWKATGAPELWGKVQSLESVRDHLNTVIRDGRLADAQVAQLVQRRKRERKYA